MNDLQAIYDELSDSFCQSEAAAKEKIRTLEDKLADAWSITKVRRDERKLIKRKIFPHKGQFLLVGFLLYMYRILGCTCM